MSVCSVQPAPASLPVARVDRDDHAVAELGDAPRRGSRRRGTRRSRSPRAWRRPAIASRTASIVRRPPPTWNRHVDRRGDPPDVLEVHGARRCARRRGRRCGARARRRRPTAARRRADRRRTPCSGRTRRGSGARPCPSRMSIAGSRIMPRALASARAAPPTKLVEHAQPVQRGLLGMELDAEHRSAADDRREPLAVLGACRRRRPRRRAAPRTSARGRRGSPARGRSASQRRAALEPHLVPADVRDPQPAGLQARDLAGDQPQARPSCPSSSEPSNSSCMPEADAEQRRSLLHARVDQLDQAELAQVAHRLRERADAGQHEPVAARAARRGRRSARPARRRARAPSPPSAGCPSRSRSPPMRFTSASPSCSGRRARSRRAPPRRAAPAPAP